MKGRVYSFTTQKTGVAFPHSHLISQDYYEGKMPISQYPWADCYLAASIISAARALLAKDIALMSMEAVKKTALDLWLEVAGK